MPPKKAAKKRTGPHDEKRHEAHHLRRAYEHLGRVQTLQRLLKDHGEQVSSLIQLAQEESAGGSAQDVADLLRAAEHLGFAALADPAERAAKVSGSVETALREKFDLLAEKSEEHWEPKEAHPTIAAIYGEARRGAEQALKKGSYREAMELMRCAEALAHVKGPQKAGKHRIKKVDAPRRVRVLAAS